jgi:hypothetical protein
MKNASPARGQFTCDPLSVAVPRDGNDEFRHRDADARHATSDGSLTVYGKILRTLKFLAL